MKRDPFAPAERPTGPDELVPGPWPEIDWPTEAEFMGGLCHALALAIHELTDWPLVAVFGHYHGREEGEPIHVGCLHPRDWSYMVDIAVVRDIADYELGLIDYDDPWHEHITPEAIREWIEEDGIFDAITDEERKAAQRLAQRIVAAIDPAPLR